MTSTRILRIAGVHPTGNFGMYRLSPWAANEHVATLEDLSEDYTLLEEEPDEMLGYIDEGDGGIDGFGVDIEGNVIAWQWHEVPA